MVVVPGGDVPGVDVPGVVVSGIVVLQTHSTDLRNVYNIMNVSSFFLKHQRPIIMALGDLRKNHSANICKYEYY